MRLCASSAGGEARDAGITMIIIASRESRDESIIDAWVRVFWEASFFARRVGHRLSERSRWTLMDR